MLTLKCDYCKQESTTTKPISGERNWCLECRESTAYCDNCSHPIRASLTWETRVGKYIWCPACTALNLLDLEAQRYQILGPVPENRIHDQLIAMDRFAQLQEWRVYFKTGDNIPPYSWDELEST